MPTLDFYGNAIEPRLNVSEMFENQQLAARDSKKFRYCAKTKAGAVPVQAVANQLRAIAKILEESKVGKVTFSLTIDEASQ